MRQTYDIYHHCFSHRLPKTHCRTLVYSEVIKQNNIKNFLHNQISALEFNSPEVRLPLSKEIKEKLH